MSIIETLITDRMESDLTELKSLLSRPLDDWTAEELAWFNDAVIKGAYNYTDLNRVTAAMEYLHGLLTGYGYATGYTPVIVEPGRTEWRSSDIPTKNKMEQYRRNISSLRSVLASLPTTPNAPDDMDGLTIEDANNIEQILADIDEIITAMSKIFLRSNMLWTVSGGPELYFAN